MYTGKGNGEQHNWHVWFEKNLKKNSDSKAEKKAFFSDGKLCTFFYRRESYHITDKGTL